MAEFFPYFSIVSSEIWPVISDDLSAQDRYVAMRANGLDHDHAFVNVARVVARRKVPVVQFQDGDTMSFRTARLRKVSDDFGEQVRHTEAILRWENGEEAGHG